MLVIWCWAYFYNLHWNNYLYFKDLLYIWEEMIMWHCYTWPEVVVSERITNKGKILRRSGEGEKDRCLPWSKEEEEAYIFWMKQVPVIVTLHSSLVIYPLTYIYTSNIWKYVCISQDNAFWSQVYIASIYIF